MDGIFLTAISPEKLKEVISLAVQDGVNKVLAKGLDSQPNTDIITRKEAAELLGVSLPTLGKWTKTGLVPAHRIASRVRYKRQEVIESLLAIRTAK